ncbi:hypothetical protein EDC01DRAFT_782800 [Geopyxis carbonaria]|nr:hypothetical protein EDC01DRAFT_782800 [Geopyxis carbonaria]
MAFAPIALYALEVPAGDQPTPFVSDIPGVATIRITMAAIDPSATLLEADQPKRATLKIIRRPLNDDYNDLSDEDESEDEEEEEKEDKSAKGKAKQAAIKKALAIAQKNVEEMEVDGEEDDEDEDSDGDFEVEEFVVCTLDPERHYQQTLDITINEEEEVFFKVVGNYDVYLTGNYVVPAGEQVPDEDSEDEDSDYDMSPDEDELSYGQEDSEDELDDVPNPRITEVASDEEETTPKKLSKTEKKNLKRAADDSAKKDDEPEKKLSKKQLKKLKANDGKAVDATQDTPDKKQVKFAKELEQGPSSSEKKKAPAAAASPAEKKADKPAAEKKETSTKKVVQGITIEDKKVGTGAIAKNGSRLGMRYIGKLTNGKTFDSNTKGKPFAFRLGKGEVIKGWDIGLVGMQVGGERRISIPANMAYGKKSLPGIPANSTLIFDVKLMEVK